MYNYTKEQALAEWRTSPEKEFNVDWDSAIINLLIGKVDLKTVVSVLDVTYATLKHEASLHR